MSTTSSPQNVPGEQKSADANGRDAQGRFALGNGGGPGNPFARQVAGLRQTLLNCVTPDDMQAVAQRLLALAKEGNLQAIKLLLAYTVGKPQPAPDPDRLDQDEWEGFKQTSGMMAETSALANTPAPSFPLQCIRATRPAIAQKMHDVLVYESQHPEERERREAEEAAEMERILSSPPPNPDFRPWELERSTNGPDGSTALHKRGRRSSLPRHGPVPSTNGKSSA